jgi:hypothetical protein
VLLEALAISGVGHFDWMALWLIVEQPHLAILGRRGRLFRIQNPGNKQSAFFEVLCPSGRGVIL